MLRIFRRATETSTMKDVQVILTTANVVYVDKYFASSEIRTYDLDNTAYIVYTCSSRRSVLHVAQLDSFAGTYKDWASTRENLSSGCANNNGAHKPAHSHTLISAFVIRFLESIISKLATSKITTVATESGLSLSLSKTSKTGFVATRPN